MRSIPELITLDDKSFFLAVVQISDPIPALLEILENLLSANDHKDANKLVARLFSVLMANKDDEQLKDKYKQLPEIDAEFYRRIYTLFGRWEMTVDPTDAFSLSKSNTLAYELFMKPVKFHVSKTGSLNDFLKTLSLSDLKNFTEEKKTLLARFIDQKSGISFGDTTTRGNVKTLIKEKISQSAAVAANGPGFMSSPNVAQVTTAPEPKPEAVLS
ncbi:MAG: hypothetical protein NTZ67_04475 [Gammaproteobacteria bacterium]|nr:hypothetical protein [Gammaproteobacteria bacterium]